MFQLCSPRINLTFLNGIKARILYSYMSKVNRTILSFSHIFESEYLILTNCKPVLLKYAFEIEFHIHLPLSFCSVRTIMQIKEGCFAHLVQEILRFQFICRWSLFQSNLRINAHKQTHTSKDKFSSNQIDVISSYSSNYKQKYCN